MFDFLDRLASDQIPIQHHISDNVWLLDDGSTFAISELTGLPWETAGDETADAWKDNINRVWKNLADDSAVLTVYDCRGLAPEAVYPEAAFRTRFAADLDAAYRRNIFARGMFQSRIFLGVQVRPPRYEGEFLAEQMEMRRKAPVDDAPESRVHKLEDICALLRSELRAYAPRRLGIRERGHTVFSEMAEALVFALTGVWRPIGMTTGRLGEAMLSEGLVFRRDAVEFVGPGGLSWFGVAFGMKNFPSKTHPTMLASLLASSYRRTVFHTFRYMETADMQAIMRRKHWRMIQAEDTAVDQADALKDEANGLRDVAWVYGDYGFTVLAFANSPEELKDVATAAWSDLAESGMVGARETRALESAFYSMVPGNGRLRPRPGYISSRNFASLAPLHAYPLGAERGYWGAPAALFVTGGKTPYRYHFHVGDVGNTFVCGRTGGGKTVLIAFLICQAERYDATVVVFDVGRGLKMLCKSLGGSYAELRDDLAPLKALSASTDDCAFLVSLIRGCILSDGGDKMTAQEDHRMHLAVRIVMSLPSPDRWLSEIRAFFAPTAVAPNGAGARLEKWCHGKELGWILDNERDTVRLEGRVIGFDQTHILDDANARGPVIATLYHYCERLIDGRKLLFVIDEFWKALLDPAFRDVVQERLRTIRKQNAAMILATQSPRDALVSDIRHVIRDQCPSQFYFANRQASWDDFGDAGMGLTRTEFDIVRGLQPGSGAFLLKQGETSIPAHLPLAGMDGEIAILSGREANTRLFDRIARDAAADIDGVVEAFHEQRKEEVP